MRRGWVGGSGARKEQWNAAGERPRSRKNKENNMKRIAALWMMCVLALAVAGCEQQEAVPPTLAPAPTVAATDTPAAEGATAEPEATAEPPTATSEEPATGARPGFCALVDATLIDLNAQGVFDGWHADCVAATPYSALGPELGGLPEHIQIAFDGQSPAGRQPGEPVLYIIPAEAYRALWDDAGNPLVGQLLDDIRGWVTRQPNAVRTQNMPVLPIEEARATNDVAVQGRFLEFDDWAGIRFVGRFAQGPAPVTNEDLRYIFQGFAGESDEYLVAAFFPVTTEALPATIEEISDEEMAAVDADPGGAINLTAVELNALTEADWAPALNLLDELVGSLQYGGAETNEEVGEIDTTPEEGRPASYAIVSGAAGVNVRTGPSTAFPSLGLAPFGAVLELIGRSVDGNWWVTPIQNAANGQGWVSAAFVDAFDTGALPVLAGPPLPATPTPIPTPELPSLNFWADRTTINQGECTTLRWSVSNIQAVWVYEAGQSWQNFPATGDGSRQVCPSQTTTYEMRVQLRDNSTQTLQVGINVNPGNALANTRWVLSSFGGQPLLPGEPPTISFGVGNHVDGFSGCNTFWGNYSTFGQEGLAMSVATRSMMACEDDLMVQEAQYITALQSVGSFAIDGNNLSLRDSGGVELLRFIRQ